MDMGDSAMKSVAETLSEIHGVTKTTRFVEEVDKENRVKLLIDKVQHPYLYGATDSHGCTSIRIDAKAELKTYIDFPTMIPYAREDTYNTHACIHCGKGFQEVDYFAMKYHADETGCKNGFCNRRCFCKKQFETIEEAFRHLIKMDCLQYHKERQEAIKRQEQKKEEYKQKKKEHNAHRKIISRCDVCNVGFRCKSEEEIHMNGLVHQYKVKPKQINNCKVCNTTTDMTPAQYQAHIQTKKHQKRIQVIEQ